MNNERKWCKNLLFSTGKIKLNPQINLPFNILIQKYFLHDIPTWNINYFVFQVGTPSIYSWQKILGNKESEKTELEFKILELQLN